MTDASHPLQLSARANIAHHERMERFYNQWLDWTAFVSLIMSCFILAILSIPVLLYPFREWAIAAIAFCATLLNGVTLLFGMREKFFIHAHLKREWIGFLAHVETTSEMESPN